MESTNIRIRTREEVLSWLRRARERKDAREKEIRAEWEERQRLRKEAQESHYYDIEWE